MKWVINWTIVIIFTIGIIMFTVLLPDFEVEVDELVPNPRGNVAATLHRSYGVMVAELSDGERFVIDVDNTSSRQDMTELNGSDDGDTIHMIKDVEIPNVIVCFYSISVLGYVIYMFIIACLFTSWALL